MFKHVTIRIIGVMAVILLALTAVGADKASRPDALAEGFRTPPDSAKSSCYWWWLDSNATKEGITRDLEEMKRQGITQAVIYDGGKGTFSGEDENYKPRIRGVLDYDPVKGDGSPIGPLFMGPEWREMFKHAVKEANRLGIEIGFNLSSGWDCGGSWVTPEHALQQLVWSKTLAEGPTLFSRALPQPPTTDGYYKDVAVIAYPWPGSTSLAMEKAGVTLTVGATSIPEYIALQFPKFFAATSLHIVPNRFCNRRGCELQISWDGKYYWTIALFDLVANTPKTVVFDEVKSRFYRVVLRDGIGMPHGNTSSGNFDVMFRWNRSGGQQSAWVVPVDDLQLLPKGESPRPAAQHVVDSRAAINLTDKMDASGRLFWSVPAGSWAVFRYGQSIYDGEYERLNKMPSPGAEGYETDILSAEAMDAQFAETAEKLASDIGPLAGRTFKYLEIDSWEAGEPNWTPRMVEEFKRRRGYDPTPYLAVLTGASVDSPELSVRFARDFRRTIADLWAENTCGRLRDQARRFGMGVMTELGEGFPVSIMDSFMNWGRNDVPLGEFWAFDFFPNLSVKATASAAHAYGKRICQAEAFTSNMHWEFDPWMLKQRVDPQFCLGLNRIMLDVYTLQPYVDSKLKPGYESFEDSAFDRNITWWEQSHAFFDYVSRCQFLLQQGRFVADVCYYAGEDAPCYSQAYAGITDWSSNGDVKKSPAGYDNDTINAEVLLTRLSVKNGRLVLPDGMSYGLLVLPQVETMSPEVLRKISALVEAGATVVGPRPRRSPSLKDYPACDQDVKTSADRLWGTSAEGSNGVREQGGNTPASEHTYGKGRIVSGKKIEEVLEGQGILPDFACEGSNLDYIHRATDDTDLYFVANYNKGGAKAECTFRVSRRQPELWDPVTGHRREAVAFTQTRDGRTRVPLELPLHGSLFVVFRKPIARGRQGRGSSNFPTFSPFMEVKSPWTVKFDPQWGGPESVEFSELVDWTKRPEEGIKYYSGKATYVKTFELNGGAPRHAGSRMYLNLGELNNVAEVRLNGQELGVLWARPFRVEISGAVKSGKNELEIDVVNLWPNRLIGDAGLPVEKWFTKTNMRKYTKDSPLMPSGLLGPVVLESVAKAGR